MKDFKQMQLDYIKKQYKEYRGIVVKKYRNFWGKYVLVINENNINAKVYVGKWIYKDTELGAKLTVGVIKKKLINIRPGFCKNTDE